MRITIEDAGRRSELEFTVGETILQVLQRNRISSVHAPCGGKGSCKKCNVYVRSADFCGSCLSCRTQAADGMIVELAPTARVSFADEISGRVYPPAPGQTGHAVACDIGTTTLVCHLLSLETGERLASVSVANAQSIYGADVLSRLRSASEGHAAEMTELIQRQVNDTILALCRKADVPVGSIRRMSVAGNTVSQYLFAGLDPSKDGLAPFTPKALFGETLDSASLGLCFEGEAYICPAVSGMIGGNATAAMLAADMGQSTSPVLLADLGANTELILGCGDSFVACTADAGAVFKASLLDRGMTASAGAIAGVRYEDGKLELKVLDDAKPVGVCGSGMIDALGVMERTGALTEAGRIAGRDDVDESVARFIGSENGQAVFYLTEDHRVYITQGDINRFQLAKAAIAAGIQILLEEYGIDCKDVARTCMAGGFGCFVRSGNAVRTGLLPGELRASAVHIGNATEAGAISAAVSEEARTELKRLANAVRVIDLPTHPSFEDAYVDGLMF